MSGIYKGPNGEQLFGDGKEVNPSNNLIGTHFSLIWEGFEENLTAKVEGGEQQYKHVYWLGRLIGTNGVGLNPPCAYIVKNQSEFIGFTIIYPYIAEFQDALTLEEAKQRITDVVKSDLPQTRLRMKEMLEMNGKIWGWKRGF
jgi:hypothetical protein